jgi:hypothetical protein
MDMNFRKLSHQMIDRYNLEDINSYHLFEIHSELQKRRCQINIKVWNLIKSHPSLIAGCWFYMYMYINW